MAKTQIGLRFPVIIIILIALLFSSCRTTREVPTVAVKPISSGKLLKKVEQNAFDYNYFTIKRINCQFSSDETNTNFKVNLKASKDEKILVSISKLNIPVGRVLLTPDSVKYVNYLERNYFIDDYSYLSDFLNIDLDFVTIQSIISNNAFSYRNDSKNKDFKTFNAIIESGAYVLQSEKERKIYKMDEKEKEGKIKRRLKRLDDETLILQKMYFSPASFALIKLIIDDKSNGRKMEMNFNDFVQIKNKDYPGTIEMSFLSTSNKVNLKIRMSGFSTEKINSFSINIPERYEQIRVN